MELSVNTTKGDEFFIGTIKEFPEVLTQGKTFELAKANRLDGLLLFVQPRFEESVPAEPIA